MPKWLLFGLTAAVLASAALAIFIVTGKGLAPGEGAGTEAGRAEGMYPPPPSDQVGTRDAGDESGPLLPEGAPGYLVIGFSSRTRGNAEAEAERRKLEGHRTHVRDSDDWSGLAPGWYVVVYDAFADAEAAGRAASALKSRGVNAYTKHSGRRKTDQEASAPDGKIGGAPEETRPLTAADEEEAVERYNAEEQEALREVRGLLDRHFTQCGDTYVTANSRGTLRQLKGVTFVVRDVTFVMRAAARPAAPGAGDGVGWSGTVQVAWEGWREAVWRGAGWDWGEWRKAGQSRSFEVRKVNSEWKVLGALEGLKRVDCSAVPL